MRKLLTAGMIVVGAALAANPIFGQGYMPGQTFSASPGKQPSSAPSSLPARTATPVPSYTPAPKVGRSRDAAPLYNVETPKAASASSRPKSDNAAAKVKATAQTAPKKVTPKTPVNTPVESKKIAADPIRKDAQQDKEVAATPRPKAVVETTGAVPLVINNLKSGRKLVALTYDDGPNPAFTPLLMAYLKENNVPATFFVCGNMVRNKPGIVKELSDAGFELANHTYDHPNLSKLSREKILDQLQDTHDLVKEASGVDMQVMRPPFGAFNDKVRDVCENMGYKIIMWDVDTNDWQGRSAAQMISTIMKGTSDGSIILMHDRLHRGKPTVMEATKAAVEQLREKGYTFVTVSEMIAARKGLAHSGDKPVAGPAHVPLPTPAPVASSTSATLAVPVTTADVVDILPGSAH